MNVPANVFGDNQSVINNATIPESPIKKKHVAICYHRVREACAAGVIRIAKEDTKTNLADLLTKNLDRQRHKLLVEKSLDIARSQQVGTLVAGFRGPPTYIKPNQLV